MCDNGIVDTVVVWVNPTPDIDVVPTDTLICNDEFAEFKVTNLNPYVRGEWQYSLVVNPDPEIIGARASADYPADSILIRDQLTNTDTIAHKVTYHFTPFIDPTDGEANCPTDRDTLITIWVNPTPRILVDFPDTIFCDNDTAVISVLHGNGAFVFGDREYYLTADFEPDSLTIITREDEVTQTLQPGTPLVDVYVNHTLQAQSVTYLFTPIISDTREGYEGNYCGGEDIVVTVWINPTPRLDLNVADTILCDSSNVIIAVSTPQGSVMGGTLVYELDVTYDAGSVSGSITGDGEWLPSQSINDQLFNDSDTVQLITYHFRARIRDDRVGHSGSFCDRGSDSIISIYLNPTPRLDYTLLDDSLCFDEGFTIITDSAVYATHPLYYQLAVTNNNSLTDVQSDGSYPVAENLVQQDVTNPHTGYGRVTYNILPYISSEGCLGVDTTFIIDVNPEPRMTAQLSRPQDTAVCFDWGYQILMGENIDSTTGTFVYELNTHGYTEPNVDNERLSGDYVIEDLDQTNVINNGEFIEDITYTYIPVIRDVNGQGKHCYGTDYDSITVQVAPELRGNLQPDTSYVGGNIVRCYGFEETSLHPNVRGGYYRNPYDFDWDTNGGSPLIPDDSVQTNLGIGEYWFEVVDDIGCYFTDTIIVTQPTELMATADIVDATCENRPNGSIDVSPTGGILGYSYDWTGPFGFTSTDQDISGVPPSPNYFFTLTDTNLCVTTYRYIIDAASRIYIDTSVTRYGNYEITCNGESTGEITINSITGGFPGYRLAVLDVFAGDTIHRQDNLGGGGTIISGLEAGTYQLFIYDQEECPNYNPLSTVNTLDEPDPILITRDTAQFYQDTVDVSCFGADDGFINLVVSGGHTADYANQFVWSGQPDPHIVQGDSIQDSLSGGTYRVDVQDFWGCQEWAEFTLFEPAQIVLVVDDSSNYNGWDIRCNGNNDGFIEISTSGGVGPHGYTWTPASTSIADPSAQDIYDLYADNFDLRVVDSIGCYIDTAFVLIQPNPLGLIDSIPRTPTGDWEIACAGDSSGQILLTPLGGADSLNNTYSWDTDIGYLADSTLMNQINLPVGTYWVRVTDINGCEFNMSYLLEEPPPLVIDTFMVDSAFCHGSATGNIDMEFQGGQPGYLFDWSNWQIPEFNETTEDIVNLLAGVYVIEITDANGCILIDSTEVFEADHFGVQVMITSDYNGAQISCNGYSDGVIVVDTTNTGGSPPYSYTWSTGATTMELANVPRGTYQVIVVDRYDCVDSAEISIDDPTAIAITPYPEDPLCYGDSTGQINLEITGGTAYGLDEYDVWLNGDLTEPFTSNLPAGVYQIRVEDLNDCFTEDETELIDPPLLELSFRTEDAFCPYKLDGEMELYIDGGVPGYWISWSGGLPDNEDRFYELQSGEYIATVTDANECVTVDTVFVGYEYQSCLVIPTAFSPNGDGYNDLWIIEGLELYSNVDMWIYDRWGSQVYYTPNAADEPWDGTFNGRSLPIDSYHVIIDVNQEEEEPIRRNVTIVR